MTEAATDNTPTVEHVIKLYRKARDLKDQIRAKHANELAPINDKMSQMENWLHKKMNEQGLDSMKTAEGTAYISNLVKASVTDGEELLKFVQESGLWHILERRVSKSAVQEYIEAQGKNIPGVHVSSESKVNIRKPTAK